MSNQPCTNSNTQLTRCLAFDFGASSGRAMLVTWDGRQLQLQEVHRFSNDPVMVGDTLYWDVLRLLHEVKQALLKVKHSGELPHTIGVDTWGVDFGLLDEQGYLLENPVHYRDKRTAGMVEKSFEKVGREAFYQMTGNQFMELNTVFQLLALQQQRPELLQRAHTLLLMPDLFNFFLTGQKVTEYTIATTTQMLDARDRDWSRPLLEKLGLPTHFLTRIVPPGTVIGRLQPSLCEELQLPPIPVTAVAGHDTQCASAAVPAEEGDFLFISCGTWALMGTELTDPIINEQSFACNLTNEGGVAGTYNFMKNIVGLWLIQESRRQWLREGVAPEQCTYAALEQAALSAPPFVSFIDPDAPQFGRPGDLPGQVRAFCQATGQPVPATMGEVMRCLYQSLAMKYRYAKEQIESCTGKRYHKIYMVGGGTKDTLLCQMTASACGCQVSAGPTEATVLGNAAVQLMAMGVFDSLQQARAAIAQSEPIRRYEPDQPEAWDEAYRRFCQIVK